MGRGRDNHEPNDGRGQPRWQGSYRGHVMRGEAAATSPDLGSSHQVSIATLSRDGQLLEEEYP